MKTNLAMEFTIDRENNKILVQREFAAPLSAVWAAWTQSELLDQWWAPKPWKSRTKSMDFTEGGYRLYAMVGPNGEEHWGRTNFTKIVHEQAFWGEDGFCDSDGNINTNMPISSFQNQFQAKGNMTVVNIETTYDSLESLENTIKMGFKEGFTMALENLDELLAAL